MPANAGRCALANLSTPLSLRVMDQDDIPSPVGIKCKQLSTEQRAAMWEAHKKRCPYTGDLIAFSELDIDHVVLITITPDELARLKREEVITNDFDSNPRRYAEGASNLIASPEERIVTGPPMAVPICLCDTSRPARPRSDDTARTASLLDQ